MILIKNDKPFNKKKNSTLEKTFIIQILKSEIIQPYTFLSCMEMNMLSRYLHLSKLVKGPIN